MAEPDPRLFDPGPQQRPDRNYDPNEWAHAPDVVWHSSFEDMPPRPREKAGNYTGFHTGTPQAAMDRGGLRGSIHPYALSGQFALPEHEQSADPGPQASGYSPPEGESPSARKGGQWSDFTVNYRKEAWNKLDEGYNLAYENVAEDSGSTSFVTKRPENLSTWSQSTLADKAAPTHLRALAEHYELVGKRTDSTVLPGLVQQMYLPGIPKGPGMNQAIETAHPQGYIGRHDTPSNVETPSRLVHTLQRKPTLDEQNEALNANWHRQSGGT